MKKKVVIYVKSKQLIFGNISCPVYLKLVLPIFSSKIMPTTNQIKKILVQSDALISVLKLFNILIMKKQLFVISLQFVCLNLLSDFVNGKPQFNHKKLIEVCSVVVSNLDHIIDINYYSSDRSKNSNLKHRPMGVGVQGLG